MMLNDVRARGYTLIIWILVLIVVLFLMFIFVGVLSFLTGEKLLFGEGSEIKVVGSENLILFDNLKDILDSEIEFNGENVDIMDAVILHLEDYPNVESDDLDFKKDSEVLAGLISDVVRERCDRFYLETFFGVINEKGLNKGNYLIESRGGLDFNFYHEGEAFEFKYFEVSCDG